MIVAYALVLLASMAFFYFTRGMITNAVLRFVISATVFFVFSIILAAVVSRGHATPPDAKTVDIEEMKKIRRELNKEDR